MSAAIDRLRRTVAAVFARPDDAISVGYGDVVAALSALDEYAHVERALREERVAERTRASAAEAECARLTTELDAARRAATFAEMERDTLRGLTDAMRADNVRLRGIVAGRTVAPSDAEITAHHDAGGSGWLVSSDRDVIPYTLCRSEARDGGASPGARWWALDASGRPCPWPTPALGAAGEGR